MIRTHSFFFAIPERAPISDNFLPSIQSGARICSKEAIVGAMSSASTLRSTLEGFSPEDQYMRGIWLQKRT